MKKKPRQSLSVLLGSGGGTRPAAPSVIQIVRSAPPPAPYIADRSAVFRGTLDFINAAEGFVEPLGLAKMVAAYGPEYLHDFWSWNGAATIGIAGGEQKICPLLRADETTFDFSFGRLAFSDRQAKRIAIPPGAKVGLADNPFFLKIGRGSSSLEGFIREEDIPAYFMLSPSAFANLMAMMRVVWPSYQLNRFVRRQFVGGETELSVEAARAVRVVCRLHDYRFLLASLIHHHLAVRCFGTGDLTLPELLRPEIWAKAPWRESEAFAGLEAIASWEIGKECEDLGGAYPMLEALNDVEVAAACARVGVIPHSPRVKAIIAEYGNEFGDREPPWHDPAGYAMARSVGEKVVVDGKFHRDVPIDFSDPALGLARWGGIEGLCDYLAMLRKVARDYGYTRPALPEGSLEAGVEMYKGVIDARAALGGAVGGDARKPAWRREILPEGHIKMPPEGEYGETGILTVYYEPVDGKRRTESRSIAFRDLIEVSHQPQYSCNVLVPRIMARIDELRRSGAKSYLRFDGDYVDEVRAMARRGDCVRVSIETVNLDACFEEMKAGREPCLEDWQIGKEIADASVPLWPELGRFPVQSLVELNARRKAEKAKAASEKIEAEVAEREAAEPEASILSEGSGVFRNNIPDDVYPATDVSEIPDEPKPEPENSAAIDEANAVTDAKEPEIVDMETGLSDAAIGLRDGLREALGGKIRLEEIPSGFRVVTSTLLLDGTVFSFYIARDEDARDRLRLEDDGDIIPDLRMDGAMKSGNGAVKALLAEAGFACDRDDDVIYGQYMSLAEIPLKVAGFLAVLMRLQGLLTAVKAER